MKYIGYWEYSPTKITTVIEKFRQMTADRENMEEKYAKIIFGPYRLFGESRGFSIFETEDPEKLANIANFYAPEVKWEFIPIHDAKDYLKPSMAEIYLNLKK
ncbi:MAG: DUF3303 family protein [Candidatus Bathyarchaeia archaeon]|nr:hypothetical protein [Candidatus Bathyarchaeota archaeon]